MQIYGLRIIVNPISGNPIDLDAEPVKQIKLVQFVYCKSLLFIFRDVLNQRGGPVAVFMPPCDSQTKDWILVHKIQNIIHSTTQNLVQINDFLKNQEEKMADHERVIAYYFNQRYALKTSMENFNKIILNLNVKHQLDTSNFNKTFSEPKNQLEDSSRKIERMTNEQTKLSSDVEKLSQQIQRATDSVSKNSTKNEEAQVRIAELKQVQQNVSSDLQQVLKESEKFRQDLVTPTRNFKKGLESLKNKWKLEQTLREEKRQKLKERIDAVKKDLSNFKIEVKKLNLAKIKERMEILEKKKRDLKQTWGSLAANLEDEITVRKKVTNYVKNSSVSQQVDDLYRRIINGNDATLISKTVDRVIDLRREIRNTKINQFN